MVIEITITSAPHCTKSRSAATFAQLYECAACHNNTVPWALSTGSHLLHQHCLRSRTAVQYSLYMYMFATKL